MEEMRLGPIEWGVVTAHNPWGLGVRLEESGDEGVIVLSSIHDDPRRHDSEYWPDIGERIRVRRYLYGSPDDEVRLTSCESAMEGLVNGYDPPRKYPPPEGFGPAQEGTVIAHCDWGVEVLLNSGQVGQLRATLMQEGFDPVPEERWPGIGERVRIRPVGIWPDGNLRLSSRPRFVDGMLVIEELIPLGVRARRMPRSQKERDAIAPLLRWAKICRRAKKLRPKHLEALFGDPQRTAAAPCPGDSFNAGRSGLTGPRDR